MKKARNLSVLVVISLLGILTAGDMFVGLNFFVETAYAKARTCADFGRAQSCAECNVKSQSCEQVFERDGPNKVMCTQCRDKRSCSSMKLLIQLECAPCVSDPTMICAPRGKDEFSQKCFECRKKSGGEIDCAYYGMPAQCPACGKDQICQPVDKSDVKHKLTCYQCRDKRRCEDKGLMTQSACSSCMSDATMFCSPQGRDDFSQDCFECRKKKGKEIDCKYYGLPAQCPTCLKNEVCEAVKTMEDGRELTCYQCRKGMDCKALGFLVKPDCASCVDDPVNICAQTRMDDFNQPCFECRKKQGKEIDCKFYGFAETCDKCTAHEICEPEIRDAGDKKITCHRCRPKQDCLAMGLLKQADCASCNAQPGMICVAQGKDEYQNTCFACVKKETCEDKGLLDKIGCDNCVKQDPVHLMCEARATATGEGTCYECVKKHGKFIDCAFFGLQSKPSGCGEGVLFKAVTKENEGQQITCYECTAIRRCKDLGLLSDCHSCMDDPSYICAPKGVSDTGTPCFECRKKEGSEIDCAYFRLRDSCGPCPERQRCVPVTKDLGDNKKITCYECKKGDICLAHGLINAEDCATCTENPNMICVPKGKDDFGVDCFDCLEKPLAEPKRITIKITWIVIIIERPHVRVVLKSSGPADSFQPSSVMALMKVDSAKFEEVKKLSEGMKGVSTFSSLQDLAQALQGLSKQKSFNQDSFKDFVEAPLPQNPPPSAGEEGSSPVFGSDEKDSAIVNGPIVACGKEKGVDVLNVFDASGIKVRSIPKEELAKDPNVLTDALAKADELSPQLMSLQDVDPKQWLAQTMQKAAATLAEPRQSEDPEAPNAIDPNDPFYFKDPGKKKSAVDERMKKVTASIFDVGANAIGMRSSDGMKGDKQALEVEDQWGIRKIGYLPKSDPNSAWNVVGGEEKNVVVAVIDSGLDMAHPDGPAYIWTNKGEVAANGKDDDGNGFVDDVNGWNFLNDNNDLLDYKGHGTFVAGIIAARRNNGIGIAGINPGVIIMPLKVADEEGNANSLNIYRAVHYAIKHGARVINISLGARGVSEMEAAVIRYAHAHGIFVAVAAGNVGENIGDHGPASALGAFSVGAMDFNGQKSTISNWGANNGIIAPGEMIYSLRSIDSPTSKRSTQEGKFYYAQSGTSFSTPMVAATASLLLARDSKLTNIEIENILQASADDIYAEGWDGESGAGVVNATATLKYAQDKFVTVKLTKLRLNKNKNGDIESVDVYATVRGDFNSFSVGLGKGKRAESFKEVAGPYTAEADNAWITRIPEKLLRGSDEWVIQIRAKDKQGKSKAAQSFITLRAPKHINDY